MTSRAGKQKSGTDRKQASVCALRKWYELKEKPSQAPVSKQMGISAARVCTNEFATASAVRSGQWRLDRFFQPNGPRGQSGGILVIALSRCLQILPYVERIVATRQGFGYLMAWNWPTRLRWPTRRQRTESIHPSSYSDSENAASFSVARPVAEAVWWPQRLD